jgi:asparagine synthetase B (glutamine-hydrolysing)
LSIINRLFGRAKETNEEVRDAEERTQALGLEPRLTSLEQRVVRLDGKTGESDALENRTGDLEGRVAKLDGKTAQKQQPEARITALEDRVTELEKKK